MTPPEYRDLVMMADILVECIETRVLPAIGSPMHRQAREFVKASGCGLRRNRLRLGKETLRKVPHALETLPGKVRA